MRKKDLLHLYILLVIMFLFFTKIISDLSFFLKLNAQDYSFYIILILIFLFKNRFNWVIGILISSYGIYSMTLIDINAATPIFSNLTWHLRYVFSISSSFILYILNWLSLLIYMVVLSFFLSKRTRIQYKILKVDSIV